MRAEAMKTLFTFILSVLCLSLVGQSVAGSNDTSITTGQDSIEEWKRESRLIFMDRIKTADTSLDLRELHLTDELLTLIPTHIRRLNLARTQISSLYYLPRKMPNLTHINLSGTLVKDISLLSNYYLLTNVNLSKTKVADLEALSQLYQLSILDLKGTNVNDLSPLEKLTKLWFLDLTRTKINNVNALGKLRNLTWLSIGQTNVDDLWPIRNNRSLSALVLAGCRYIRDVKALRNLKNMKDLYIMNTNIEDLTPIKKLKLNDLWLFGSQVKNTSVFESPPQNLILKSDVKTEFNPNQGYTARGKQLLNKKADRYLFGKDGMQTHLFGYEYAKAYLDYSAEDFEDYLDFEKTREELVEGVRQKFSYMNEINPRWTQRTEVSVRRQIQRLQYQGKDELQIIKYFEIKYKAVEEDYVAFAEKVSLGTFTGTIDGEEIESPKDINDRKKKEEKAVEDFNNKLATELEEDIAPYEFVKTHKGYFETERQLILRMIDKKVSAEEGLVESILEYLVSYTFLQHGNNQKLLNRYMYVLYENFKGYIDNHVEKIENFRKKYEDEPPNDPIVATNKERVEGIKEELKAFTRSVLFGFFEGAVVFEGVEYYVISPKNSQKKFIFDYLNTFTFPLVYKSLDINENYTKSEKEMIRFLDQYYRGGVEGINKALMKYRIKEAEKQNSKEINKVVSAYLNYRFKEVEEIFDTKPTYKFEEKAPNYLPLDYGLEQKKVKQPNQAYDYDSDELRKIFELKKEFYELFREYVEEGMFGGDFEKTSSGKVSVLPSNSSGGILVNKHNVFLFAKDYLGEGDYFPNNSTIFNQWSETRKTNWFRKHTNKLWGQNDNYLYTIARKVVPVDPSEKKSIPINAMVSETYERCKTNYKKYFLTNQYKTIYKGVIRKEYYTEEKPTQLIIYCLCTKRYVPLRR